MDEKCKNNKKNEDADLSDSPVNGLESKARSKNEKENSKEVHTEGVKLSNKGSKDEKKKLSPDDTTSAKPGVGIERHFQKVDSAAARAKNKRELDREAMNFKFEGIRTVAEDDTVEKDQTPMDMKKISSSKKLLSLCADLFKFAPKTLKYIRKIIIARLYLLLSKKVLPKLLYDGTPMRVELSTIQRQIQRSVFEVNPELAGHRVSCEYIRNIILTDILPAMNREIETLDPSEDDHGNEAEEAVEGLPIAVRMKEIPQNEVPQKYVKPNVMWIMVTLKLDVDVLNGDEENGQTCDIEEDLPEPPKKRARRRAKTSDEEDYVDDSD